VIGRLTRSLWVRLAITIAVLAYLASKVDLADAVSTILQLSPIAAITVLALLAVDRGLMIWRWVILLRATGHTVLLKSAVWIYLVSSFIGSFLPAGVGGDVARAYTLTQRTSQGHDAVASVAVDRILGMLSILLVGLAGVAVSGQQTGAGMKQAVLIGAVAGVIGTVAFLSADQWVRRIIPPQWHATGAGRIVLGLGDAVSRYRGHRGALASVLALSIGVQVLRILQAYVLGRGIGIDVPLAYYFLFMPPGLIALMLPVSVSGFGAPQVLMVWMLEPVGVPRARAFALSTLIVLSGIVANLPGAWLYLRERRPDKPES
jgi:hypothetical protein